MARQSYARVMQQIKSLEAEAQMLRDKEVADVIARIREAIKVYDITPDMLFGKGRGRTAAKKRATGAKYSDGKGQVWGGRGPRPRWLREALASGRKLEEFSVAGTTKVDPGRKTRPAAKGRASTGKASKKGVVAAKYRDESGNTWSGRGPRPHWLRDALASGKSIEEFRV